MNRNTQCSPSLWSFSPVCVKMRFPLFLWLFIAIGSVASSDAIRRSICTTDGDVPPNRVNSTEVLQRLRRRMSDNNIVGYILPSNDEHSSEYVAVSDKRIEYISGFSGSSATAVILRDRAALKTDGRYELQADQELDCNWEFLDQPMVSWLKANAPTGSSIGADANLFDHRQWIGMTESFQRNDLKLTGHSNNLVDDIWISSEKPSKPSGPIYVHDVRYAGQPWKEKVEEVLQEVQEIYGAQGLVVTSLDEIAWLFNLRGSDLPYSPLFKAFAFVGRSNIKLYVELEKVTPTVRHHLKTDNCTQNKVCVEIRDYRSFLSELSDFSQKSTSKILVTEDTSYAVYSMIPDVHRTLGDSPIPGMKAIKNKVQVEGMKSAHVRDALAICDLISRIAFDLDQDNKEDTNGTWDEMRAAQQLTLNRKNEQYYRGDSFGTTSAVGANGAKIHYKPTAITNRVIDKYNIYLLDSGGQYLDGTTDVTRTFHFGVPTDLEKEAYTRVLMGAIDMMSIKFPLGFRDSQISDMISRQHLFDIGLNYKHGTCHGIGAFLNVHESPPKISGNSSTTLREGMFFSVEPGYYEKGRFGIRIENIVLISRAETTHHFEGKDYLGFEPVTLVPLEPNLMKVELLSKKHRKWINEYNDKIRLNLGHELKARGKDRAFQWMTQKTSPISEDDCPVNAVSQRNVLAAHLYLCYVLIYSVLCFY